MVASVGEGDGDVVVGVTVAPDALAALSRR
jgi:hypothetical protein